MRRMQMHNRVVFRACPSTLFALGERLRNRWKWGIQFALVDTRCSGGRRSRASGRRSGLPAYASGVRRLVRFGGWLCGVSPTAAVAGRISLSGVRRPQSVADSERADVLRIVPTPDVGHGRDHLRGYPKTPPAVVPSDVVRHEPEIRRECVGTPERLGSR